MDKKYKMFAIMFGVLILLGFLYSMVDKSNKTSTTKTVVVKPNDHVVVVDNVNRHVVVPPPRYNSYEAQFYN